MTNVKLKAVDTLHISSVSPHNLHPGEEFEVSTHIAEDLEKRGLATRVAEVADSPAEPKAEAKAAKPTAAAKRA